MYDTRVRREYVIFYYVISRPRHDRYRHRYHRSFLYLNKRANGKLRQTYEKKKQINTHVRVRPSGDLTRF